MCGRHFRYTTHRIRTSTTVPARCRMKFALRHTFITLPQVVSHIAGLRTRLKLGQEGKTKVFYFIGALGYADDIVLLTPSASALRIMLNTSVVNLPMITAYYLIQEKHNLFDFPYLALHLAHLHHRLFCLLTKLSSWLKVPVI